MKITTGRERTLPPFVLGFASACLAALILLAPTARAVTAPDSSALDRMRATAASLNRFRVVTDRGEFTVGSLQVDASGARVGAGQEHPALVTAGAATRDERSVEWARIEHVDGMRSHAARDGLVGAIVGTGIAFAIAGWLDHNYDGAGNLALVVAPLSIGVCGGLGALHGASTGWRRLYP